MGFKQKEILKNIFDVVKSGDLEKLDDNILKNILILEEDREQLQYLLSTSQIQRFDSYQKKVKDKKILSNIFTVYEKSLKSLQTVPNIYFGDVTYCNAKERSGAYENFGELMKKWDDILLGNVEYNVIDGNHYTCIDEAHALSLAKFIQERTRDAVQ